VVKWLAYALAFALACTGALTAHRALAQTPRDPLIVPEEGGQGSRFQIVGQIGWTAGSTVTIELAFTTSADPLHYDGPFQQQRTAMVLRDGTWSFPISVADDVLGLPLDDTPGFIVVRAQSGTRVAVNAFVFSPGGKRPAGAEAIAHLGFGPSDADPTFTATMALFFAGVGALLLASGTGRRRGGLRA
jgi:hypothetical protein